MFCSNPSCRGGGGDRRALLCFTCGYTSEKNQYEVFCKLCRLTETFDGFADGKNLEEIGWDTNSNDNKNIFENVKEQYIAQEEYFDRGFNNRIEMHKTRQREIK